MHLEIHVQRVIILSPEAIEDITVKLSDYTTGDGSHVARLADMHRQAHQTLDAIEADLREPQPQPAAPHLVREAGQGSPAVQRG